MRSRSSSSTRRRGAHRDSSRYPRGPRDPPLFDPPLPTAPLVPTLRRTSPSTQRLGTRRSMLSEALPPRSLDLGRVRHRADREKDEAGTEATSIPLPPPRLRRILDSPADYLPQAQEHDGTFPTSQGADEEAQAALDEAQATSLPLGRHSSLPYPSQPSRHRLSSGLQASSHGQADLRVLRRSLAPAPRLARLQRRGPPLSEALGLDHAGPRVRWNLRPACPLRDGGL